MKVNKLVLVWCAAAFIIVSGFVSLLFQDRGQESASELEAWDQSIAPVPESPDIFLSDERKMEEEEPEPVLAHICGSVKKPGVYRLEAGNRIYDLIEKAGGLADGAAGEAVNQARIVSDGEKVYIPSQEEVQQNEPWEPELEQKDCSPEKININTASKEELLSLPGIGQTKAESILRYRQEHGPFQSIEDITHVEGIKAGVYEKIKDSLMV